MDKKWIKIIVFAGTLIGFATSLVNDWVKDKEIEEKISEAIIKQLSNKES